MGRTWTDVMDDIKVRGAIPTNQQTYTAQRLLNLTQAVLLSKIVPMVMKVREGYYRYHDDRAISSLVNGTCLISPRAIGGKLTSAGLLNGTQRYNLCRYYEHELIDTTQPTTTDPGFLIDKNTVTLLPTDGSGFSTLRLTILLRPNTIVDPTAAAQVTGINTGTKVVTCSTVPSTWTTSDTFDILQADDPYDWWAIDQTISAITTGASGTLTFVSALPSTLVVGDWIALARQSPTVQCPEELHPLLAQEVANVVLRTLGNKSAADAGESESKLMHDGLLAVINPRVEEEGKKLAPTSGIFRRRY